VVAKVNSVVARRREVKHGAVVIDISDVDDDVTRVARQRRR